MRQVIRWGVRHGLIRVSTTRGAKAGEVSARLMVDPAYVADPYPHYETIRARGLLVDNGFVLNTVSHRVATAVLRSTDFGVIGGYSGNVPRWLRLASAAGGRGPIGPVEPPSMLAVDAPDHTRYRKLVSRAFTAKAVAALRERAGAVAEELLDEMAASGSEVDLVAEYASLLPATIIAEMLGVPVAMRREFLEWGAEAARSIDAGLTFRQFRQAEAGPAALQRWMEGHLDDLKAPPDGSILSARVHAHSQDGTRASRPPSTSSATGWPCSPPIPTSSRGCAPIRRCGRGPPTRCCGSTPPCSAPAASPTATPRWRASGSGRARS